MIVICLFNSIQILFKKGVPLLMPNKSGARGIHTAASKGHVAVVNSLIVKGENVDAATNVNITSIGHTYFHNS